MIAYRPRPDWQALVYQQGLALVVGCKLADGLVHERWKLYSGVFFPWGRKLLPDDPLPVGLFWGVLAVQVALLALYALRIKPRLSGGLLALALLFDTLVSFQNHRLLLVILVALVALKPVPPPEEQTSRCDQHVYWNLDLVGWLVSTIYFVTALHKATPEFLSGEALSAVFHYVQVDGARPYPDAVWALLQDPRVAAVLAVLALLTEVALAVSLHLRRAVGYAIPVAIGMHAAFFLLMPYIWVFSLVMALNQIAFLPARVAPGRYVLHPGAGAPRLAGWVWPGALEVAEAGDGPWALERPDGERLRGLEAWLELASLSPWTFLFAETLRTAPARWLLKRWVA